MQAPKKPKYVPIPSYHNTYVHMGIFELILNYIGVQYTPYSRLRSSAYKIFSTGDFLSFRSFMTLEHFF